jgi:hypothetical protein
MHLNLRSEQIAGLLSFLAAALAGANWYMYRFVASPSERPFAESAFGQLAYSLAPENADRWWFIWLAALPLALTVVGAAYLSQLARNQAVAMLLLAVSAILAGSSFLLANWSLAVFVALPTFWAWRCVRGT